MGSQAIASMNWSAARGSRRISSSAKSDDEGMGCLAKHEIAWQAPGSRRFTHENRVLNQLTVIVPGAACQARDEDAPMRSSADWRDHPRAPTMADGSQACVMHPAAICAGRRHADPIVRLRHPAGTSRPTRMSGRLVSHGGRDVELQQAVRHIHLDKANDEKGNADQRAAARGKPHRDY
jgi:hypothetical protein